MSYDTNKFRYLSVFIDRFVPQRLRELYPNFTKFVEYFLNYLEQDNGIYYNIENYINFSDIDAIIEYKNSVDPEKQELGDLLLDEIYAQMLGTKNARYLSSLIDDELYLKKQKSIIQYKGTRYSIMFFFLLILGGYWKIANANSTSLIHNGVFNYNGLVAYAPYGSPDSSSPFIYMIISEFYPAQYTKILKALNPAGVLPVTFLQKTFYFDDQTKTLFDYQNIRTYPRLAVMYYQTNATTGAYEYLGYLPAVEKYDVALSASDDVYDVETNDYRKWVFTDMQTGSPVQTHFYFETDADETSLALTNTIKTWVVIDDYNKIGTLNWTNFYTGRMNDYYDALEIAALPDTYNVLSVINDYLFYSDGTAIIYRITKETDVNVSTVLDYVPTHFYYDGTVLWIYYDSDTVLEALNPSTLSIEETLSTTCAGGKFTSIGNSLFYVNASNELCRLEYDSSFNTTITTSATTITGTFTDIATDGQYIFLSHYTGNQQNYVSVYNTLCEKIASNQTAIADFNYVYHMTVYGDYIYLLNDANIYQIDKFVTDVYGTVTIVATSATIEGSPQFIKRNDDLLYLTTPYGILCYNLDSLLLVDKISGFTNAEPYMFDLDDTYIYRANYDKLKIFEYNYGEEITVVNNTKFQYLLEY